VAIKDRALLFECKIYCVISQARKLQRKKNIATISVLVCDREDDPSTVAEVQLAYITVLRGIGFLRRVGNFSAGGERLVKRASEQYGSGPAGVEATSYT